MWELLISTVSPKYQPDQIMVDLAEPSSSGQWVTETSFLHKYAITVSLQSKCRTKQAVRHIPFVRVTQCTTRHNLYTYII
jgi:hypothetical protein